MKLKMTALALCSLTLIGCTSKKPLTPQDPYEPLNRQMFKINTCLDKTVLRPAAIAYNHLIPSPIQQGVSNAFNNLLGPEAIVNDLLQGKPKYAVVDFLRTLLNSTLGILGVIDVAKHMGLPVHSNDFGKTFAVWSANKKSAYLMIPFFGPSTLRDAIGLPLAATTNPLFYFQSNVITYVPFAVYYVNLRAELLPLDKLIEDSFDPYAAVRDAYLQRRNEAVIANAATPDYSRHNPGEGEKPLTQYVAEGANLAPVAADDDFTFGDEPAKTKK